MTANHPGHPRRWHSHRRQWGFAIAALVTVTAGCTYQRIPLSQPKGDVIRQSGDPEPRPEVRSRYGNPASYEQFGRRYVVMDSAANFRERGIASWYGPKFHGKRTSSGETYDMHAMTAAHKTLPLPTWVEVRNLKNNKSVFVKVNDRGPFVENRVIDLSRTAAERLDIITDGTGLVEVTVLEFDSAGNLLAPVPSAPLPAPIIVKRSELAPLGAAQASASTPVVASEPEPAITPATTQDTTATMAHTATAVTAAGDTTRLYAQVGAFSLRDNAEGLFIRLRDSGFDRIDIVENPGAPVPLFRVRVGPTQSVADYDILVDELNASGIDQITLVIE